MYKKWFSITYLCGATKLSHSIYYYNCKHDTSLKYDPTLLKHVELLHDLDKIIIQLSLILDTIENALNLSNTLDLTLHCDHGSHFTFKDFIKSLKNCNVKLSMSRLGSPEDNQSI